METQQNKLMASPAALISQAIDKGSAIEQLEKLMDLQERWEKKEAQKAFFEAMNSFQSNKPVLTKSNDVVFKGQKQYSFLPLSKMQNIVDPVLSQFGLSYSWRQENIDDKTKITCIVKHHGGHSEENWLSSAADTSGSKNAIQSIGSAVSYLKRYTFMNAFGLSTQDDDGASSQLTKEEIEVMALEKLEALVKEKKEILSKSPKINNRVKDIIKNKESSSYKKAIKTIKEL